MSCLNAIKFKIHHVTQEGIVMFIPIKDEDNPFMSGALNLDTGRYPSITEEYRKAKEQRKTYIFNGATFRRVD